MTSYSFFDTEQINKSGKMSEDYCILMHHIGLFITVVLNITLFLTGDTRYTFLIYLGFMSELSTPFLNYLKIRYHHQKPAPYLHYKLFAILYFLCRPVTLSYISYQIYHQLDWLSVNFLTTSFISSIFFLILNLYWFSLIVTKFYCL